MWNKEDLGRCIEDKRDVLTALSDEIWGYAETRFDLRRSADALCRVLEAEGFTVTRGVADMDHAIVAEYGSGKPVIGILGEYDALPDISQEADALERRPAPGANSPNGHGCGHHALGVGSLAAAAGVKAYMIENGLAGTVRFYGCPAEESGSGKAFMARAGCFADLDSVISWHPGNNVTVQGVSTLANYQIYFTFTGVSAHAAAAPHAGRSALDAAELMSVGVNYLREHISTEARIHYAYIDAGGKAPNVVQPTATVLYFIRAPKSAQLREIFARVVDVAKGAALMTGTKMHYTWDSACAECIVNDRLGRVLYDNVKALGPMAFTPEEEAYARGYADQLSDAEKRSAESFLFMLYPPEQAMALLQKPVIGDILPYMMTDRAMPGSSDVGDASWHAPTAQIMTTCYPVGTVPHSWQQVACGKSPLLYKGMLYAAKAMAMAVVDLLENPQIVEEAKKEHQMRLAGEKYASPIPPEVLPQ